jgi:hypothetical protein
VLYALSSPNVKGGVFTNLVFARDQDGTPLTNSIVLGDPCDMCRSTAHPEQCTHKNDTLASWKNPERMAHLAKWYRAIGREDVYRAELSAMGNVIDDSVFPKSLYDGFLSAPPVPPEGMFDAVYVGVDPAFGGKCQFALTAIGQISTGRPGFQVRHLTHHAHANASTHTHTHARARCPSAHRLPCALPETNPPHHLLYNISFLACQMTRIHTALHPAPASHLVLQAAASPTGTRTGLSAG